ncbi:ABC transporter substrate-binding protein [Methylobacterium oxalidis]
MADDGAPRAGGRLNRIVSMNLCADELLLRLAGRERIASVTWLAADPRGSTVAREAAGLLQNHGLAEEIAGLEPDLVLAGVYTTRTAVGLIRRFGLPVVEVGSPGDFDALRAEIRRVAAAIGGVERGEGLIAELDAGLAAATPKRPTGLRALVMRPNALTVSPGSFGDAIIRQAGLVNVAAELGRGGAGQVPLEVAALAYADLIVMDEEDGAPSLATAILHHPVLKRLAGEGRLVTIPNRLWTCPGPQAAEVIRRLANAADSRKATR